MTKITAKAHRGSLKDDTTGIETAPEVITGQPIGPSKMALDVVANGVYPVATGLNPEAGSTDRVINATGHVAQRGDLIRWTTKTALEREMYVADTTANTIILVGNLSTATVVGDVYEIHRAVTPTYDSDGAIGVGIVRFLRDSISTQVTEDTGTPANNRPLPVKLMDLGGDVAINVANQNLAVDMTHVGANADSIRIGDGTETLAINASNEALVHDTSALAQQVLIETAVNNVSAQLPATIGQKARAASTSVAWSTEDQAIFDSLVAKFGAIGQQARAASAAVTLSTEDVAVLTTLSAKFGNIGKQARAASASVTMSTEDLLVFTDLAAKFGAIGQQARAASAAVTLSTEDQAILDAMSAKLPAALGQLARAASMSTAWSTEDQAIMDAMSAKLPASLGAKTSANSMSVTLGTDTHTGLANLSIVSFSDLTITSITGAAYTQLTADTGGSEVRAVQIFMSTGDPMLLAVGAAAAEVDQLIVIPGGSPHQILPITIPANSRVSLKRLAAGTTASGQVLINYMG